MIKKSLTLLTVLLILGPLVSAEHEVNHRFTIVGAVTDSGGNPLPGTEVKASDNTIGVSGTAVTDSGGNYRIQLHLHDENLGDSLEVSVEGITYTGLVAFNPTDLQTERILSLNLRGGEWKVGNVTSDTGAGSNLLIYLLVAVIIILIYKGVSAPNNSKSTSKKRKNKKKKKGS